MKVTEAQLKLLIVEICGIDESIITENATFKEDLRMDSLNIADLIASLEEDYEIVVNQSDALGIRTFGQLIQYIKKLS